MWYSCHKMFLQYNSVAVFPLSSFFCHRPWLPGAGGPHPLLLSHPRGSAELRRNNPVPYNHSRPTALCTRLAHAPPGTVGHGRGTNRSARSTGSRAPQRPLGVRRGRDRRGNVSHENEVQTAVNDLCCCFSKISAAGCLAMCLSVYNAFQT